MKDFKKKLSNLNDKKTEAFLEAIAGIGRPHLIKYLDESERKHFIVSYDHKNSRNEKIEEILNQTPFNEYEIKSILKAVYPPFFTPIRITYLVAILIVFFFIGAFFIYRSLPKVYAIGSMVEVYRDPSCQQKNMQQISLFGKGVNNEKNESYMILKDSTATSYKVIDAGFFGWLFNTATPKYIKKAETTMEIAPYEKILEPLKNEQDLFDLTAEDRKAIKRAFDKPEFAGASIVVGTPPSDNIVHHILMREIKQTNERVILFRRKEKSDAFGYYVLYDKDIQQLKSGYLTNNDDKMNDIEHFELMAGDTQDSSVLIKRSTSENIDKTGEKYTKYIQN